MKKAAHFCPGKKEANMAEYDKESKTWRADVSVDGKRYRRRGFLDRNHAEIWEGQIRWKHECQLLSLPAGSTATIASLFDAYVAHTTEYRASKSADSAKRAVKVWLQYCRIHDLVLARELTASAWDGFRAWRSDKRPATLNKDLLAIRCAFALALKRQIVDTNPFAGIEMLPIARAGMPRYLTTEEIRDIEEYALAHSPQFYDAFAVLVRTGMRVGELCALTARNIGLTQRVIILEPGQTKGKRLRIVPLGDTALQIITRLMAQAKESGRLHLFANRDGTAQTRENLFRRLRTALCNLPHLNAKGVNVHTLRKTYISHAVMAGTDPAKVMAIVGHQSWATMRVYLALSPQYLAAQINLPY